MLRAVELCAGAGGLSLGLERARIHPVALIDNDPHACATLRVNRPRWNTIEADLQSFDLSPWAGVDLLSGGLPCPPYSLAGKQHGEADERDLFPAMLRIVETVQPRAVLIENVRGLMQAKFEPVRERVDSDLRAMGFDPYWAMLNAADYSTPQNRSRVFLIATKRGETGELVWPFPTMGAAPTVGETLGDLMAADGWHGAEEWAAKANRVAPTIVGGSKKHGGPDLGPTRAREEWAALGVDGLGIADSPPPRIQRRSPAHGAHGRPYSGLPRRLVVLWR
ncbi:MAG: DNA (cytosine-5-)-methyltransferase [Defluviicoccus sp.]|nr:DNA (cytosine-5-)-methyltransferase [Defluviicoccus sp.]